MAYGIGEVRGMRDIGKNIRTLRERRGLTQEELAQALFVTRQTVSNYETGKSRPDIDMLISIAQVLETDVNQVLYGLPPEQDRQREVRRLIVGCLILVAIFLLMTIPAPLMNKIIQRRYVGADLVMALTCLMKPALWLLSGWCALQGLGLLRVARPLVLAYVLDGLGLVGGCICAWILPSQVIQDGLGVPYEDLAEVPQNLVFAWLASRLLMLNVLYPQVYTVLGVALWLFRFPKR